MFHTDPAKMTRPQLVDELKVRNEYEGMSRFPVERLREQVVLSRNLIAMHAGATPVAAEPTVGLEVLGDEDPELVETSYDICVEPAPEPELGAGRVERLHLAKAEAKALRSWEAGEQSQTRPSTPNLDSIRQDSERQGAKMPRTSTTKTTEVTAEVIPPKIGRGETMVELKSAKHGDVVGAPLEGDKIEHRIEPTAGKVEHLIFRNTDAQRIVDILSAAATVSKHIYDTRLLVATTVMIRRRFPKVAQAKASVTSRLIDGLNAKVADGYLDSWDVTIKIDGSLTFLAERTRGEPAEGGARWLAGELDIPITGKAAASA